MRPRSIWLELWDQVGERLSSKEMPPAKSKQPTDDERQKLLAWVKHVADSQVNCDKLDARSSCEKRWPAVRTSRRLNRIEYNNTLRDLFGVDVHAGDLLPSEGGGGEGFDNAGRHAVHHAGAHGEIPGGGRVGPGHVATGAGQGQGQAAANLKPTGWQRLAASSWSPFPDARRRAPRGRTPGARCLRAPRLPPAGHRQGNRPLPGHLRQGRPRGDPYEQSLKLALKGVLISPSFLFLIETPPEKNGRLPARPL